MSETRSHSDQRLAILLVSVWIVVVVTGFWWFQYKDLRSFASESSVVFFQGEQFSNQLSTFVNNVGSNGDAITVVHFWDPACSCNKFNEPHVNDLIKTYSGQNLRFVIVARVKDASLTKQVLAKASKVFNHPAVVRVVSEHDVDLETMPSSPAVAVINSQRNLMYFGPYSVGAVCNVENGAFVEKALQQMSQGNVKKQLNVLAMGCFCSWGNNKQSI